MVAMYISVLGRQADISIAELESIFDNVSWFSDNIALFDSPSSAATPDVQRLGGSQKLGRVVAEIETNDPDKLNKKITQYYVEQWANRSGKVTLGISFYDVNINPRNVQKLGLTIKSRLKAAGVSLRLIPNEASTLSTATSHHNKLGLSDNKVELIIAKGSKGGFVVAESLGSQNITALARRDQGRPKRDAFVGMLPPKLAQIMINLSAGHLNNSDKTTILDPFCGTGVLLQEAALLGYSVYGTDISEKMVRYSRENLNWLAEGQKKPVDWYLHEGDAIDTKWRQPIDAVASETYLGQPFSAPPSPAKLVEVRDNCNKITSNFLKNLHSQIEPGTPVCLAVPAWRSATGTLNRLALTKEDNLAKLGYHRIKFKNINPTQLIYYREDQVVARELLVITKS